VTRRLLFLLPALGFILIAGYFLWGLSSGRDPSYIPSTMISKAVPQFDLAPVDGVDLPGLSDEDLKQGEVVLVNFFASWCVPCRAEHPYISALAENDGIPLYGINHRDKPEDAARWLDRLGNSYSKIGADPGRAVVEWGVYGVPETFVVDGQGQIRYHHRGPLLPDIIEAELLPAIEAARQ